MVYLGQARWRFKIEGALKLILQNRLIVKTLIVKNTGWAQVDGNASGLTQSNALDSNSLDLKLRASSICSMVKLNTLLGRRLHP
ncbi:Uncharacterised protein [Serratia odorifera]|jgi:hypothetical protein|uniref:Uncharacterized protein n=1 Tax=Serratia odorifera TaxID=618 RepID=A0A3S5D767_SEROD|nr:Uncharacterised protein [Serratia odorifera]